MATPSMKGHNTYRVRYLSVAIAINRLSLSISESALSRDSRSKVIGLYKLKTLLSSSTLATLQVLRRLQ